MSLNKLSLDDLLNISGGTLDDAFDYLDELCVKYGLEVGDYASLAYYLTDEEVETFSERH